MFISQKQKNSILIAFLTSPLILSADNILNKNNKDIFYLENKEILIEKELNQVSWINDINLSFKYNKNYNELYDNSSDDYTSVNLTIKNKIFDSSIYSALFNSNVIKDFKTLNLNKNKSDLINKIYLRILEYQKNTFLINKLENKKENLLTDKDVLIKNTKLKLNTELDINKMELNVLNIELELEQLIENQDNIYNYLSNNSLINSYNIQEYSDYIIKLLNKKFNEVTQVNTFLEQDFNNRIKLKEVNINVEKYKKFGSLEFLYSYSYQKDPYQFRIITKDESFKHNQNIELKYNIPIYSIKSNTNSELLRVQKLKLLSEQAFSKNKFENNQNLFQRTIHGFNKKIDIISRHIAILEKIYFNSRKDFDNNLIVITELNKSNNAFENGILDLQIEKYNKYIYILKYLKSFNISY